MKDKNAISNTEKTDQDKASEMELGGDIALVGFNILEPAELVIVKKMVGTYVKKMSNHGTYKEMRLTLQQHPHGKTFKHQVSGLAMFNEGRFNSEVTDWNLYTAISQVCEKIIQEVTHMKGRKESKGPKNSEPNLEGKLKK